MSDEVLGQRKRALEEAFFAKENERLRQRLIEQEAATNRKSALRAATGITDDAALEKLAAMNIGPEALSALSLVPLVLVAWADGKIENEEREAVLSAAGESGIAAGTPNRFLLESWLTHKPAPDLFDTWQAYVKGLVPTLAPAAREELRMRLLGRARAVAEAAGGFLGLGRKISEAEDIVLKRLESAFG